MRSALFISRQTLIRLVITSLFVTLVAAVFVGFSLKLSKDFSAQNQASSNLLRKEWLINSMIQQIGYGHFIHNFKNLVIRRDSKYLEQAIQDYARFNELLLEYRKIAQSDAEADYLATLQSVLDVYKAHLVIMQESDLTTISVAELDQLIRVDDSAAVAVLESLYKFNQRQIQGYEAKVIKQHGQLWGLNLLGVGLLLVIILYALENYRSQKKILSASATEQQSKAFLEQVLNNTHSTVLVTNEFGKIVEANESIYELTGYEKSALIGKSIEEIVPHSFAEQRAIFRASLNRDVNQPNKNIDLALISQSGETIAVAMSFSAIEFNGQAMVVSVLHDVSEERKIMLELQRSKKFLQQSQQVAEFSSWLWNIETGEVTWSDYASELYGIDLGDNSFNTIVQYVHPDDKNYVVDAIQTTVVLRSDFKITYRLVLPDGSFKVIKEEGKPFVEASGDTIIIGTARNITEEFLNNEQLKMADLVFNHSQDGIIVTDQNQRIKRVNRAFSEITGYSAEQALTRTPQELLSSGRHDAHFYTKLWHAISERGEWNGEIWDVNAKGESFLSQQYICKVSDEQTQGYSYVSIMRDITQAHMNEELLRKRAYFDTLTKLPNRMLFQDRLCEKLAKVRRGESRFALCFVDLDGFKQINDNYGHEAGDLVLKTVASKMAFNVRDSDTVARLAGDEFTLILDEVKDSETAVMLADKLIASINEPISFNESLLRVGASFGIIIVNKKSQDTVEELLSFADKAMYQAKQAGKNRAVVYHHPELD